MGLRTTQGGLVGGTRVGGPTQGECGGSERLIPSVSQAVDSTRPEIAAADGSETTVFGPAHSICMGLLWDGAKGKAN